MRLNAPIMDPPLPRFSQFDATHSERGIEQLLAEIRDETDRLLGAAAAGWADVLLPIEDLDDCLNRAWSPISHLHNVADTDATRAAYNACLPKLTAYSTEKYQNESLYRAYRRVRDGVEYMQLSVAERRIVDNALRDFRLAGIELPPRGRERYKQLKQELAQLQTRFEENLLDATHAWKRLVTDVMELEGVPDSVLALARSTAEREGADGWLLTLDLPCYRPIMAYCANRALREEMYRAYVIRASDIDPDASKWDNSRIMDDILVRRTELARLLGFESYSEYSLATKMAKSIQQVLDFLNDLARRSKPVAEQEMRELREFARKRFHAENLEAWDIAYFSERLREQHYSLSHEELRPYFPIDRVLDGLFEVVSRIYGLSIAQSEADVWHPDVSSYSIRDSAGNLRGMFYLDPYARPLKRGGAWMDECTSRRRRSDGTIQIPVAYLNCNFSPPLGAGPALLTHDEVLTLFHEFGHGLHHLLTLIDRPGVAGINGVAWDAVELPSQFMENWCWEPRALELMARHFQTGAPLDVTVIDRLRSARNFQAGMQMLRQVEFALFDFRLHKEYEPANGRTVQAILDEVRRAVAVVRPPPFNRFQHGFSHIFAGGYAAGYYSYKWAEVLSADAFSKFEEKGVFDRRTGEEFLHLILEAGGSADAMELFTRFRGRAPTVDALLRHSRIA